MALGHYGKQVGNKQAVAALKANSRDRVENLRAILADIRRAGITSVRKIAAVQSSSREAVRGTLLPSFVCWIDLLPSP